MNAIRGVMSVSALVAVVTLVGVWLSTESYAQSSDARTSIAGAWTINSSLSDSSAASEQGTGERGRRGERGGGRGGGRGGFGRGGGGGRGGYGRAGANPAAADETARMRDAMRDVIDPPAHLVITQTESMVVMTSGEGRTIRLAPDGKSIRDDNTKVERKTRWDSGKLVCEINGLGPAKMTQTFAIAPELRQLRITVQIEAKGSTPARTITHVYDADENR